MLTDLAAVFICRLQATDAQTAPVTAKPSSKAIYPLPVEPAQRGTVSSHVYGKRATDQVPGYAASKSAVTAGFQTAKSFLENSKQEQMQSVKDRQLPRVGSDAGSTQDDPHDAALHQAASGDDGSAFGRESPSPMTPAADLVDLSVDSDLDMPQQSNAVKQPASMPTIASRKRPRQDSGGARQLSDDVIDLSNV